MLTAMASVSPFWPWLSAAEYPTPGFVDRLAHEYALKDELDGGSAARPLALVREHGRTMLVLEDPGGAPLDRLLGRPLEVSQFLRIAIPLAALRRVHEQGLVHKDIKPANMLVELASGSVWLTGFGIASRLPREHQPPAPPEVIAGTLAYMAPEQTGTNESLDRLPQRSLFAWASPCTKCSPARCPFTAPIRWNGSIATLRGSRCRRRAVAGRPGAVSAIVMKLLAKTAEERYQTAAGVEADLRRALAEWESQGPHRRCSRWAQHDTPDRLAHP